MNKADTILLTGTILGAATLIGIAVILKGKKQAATAALPPTTGSSSGTTTYTPTPAPTPTTTPEHSPWEIYFRDKPDPTEKLGPFVL